MWGQWVTCGVGPQVRSQAASWPWVNVDQWREARHVWPRRCCTTPGSYQGRLEIAAAGGADAPMNQSREAHHAARPLHSPRGHALAGAPKSGTPPWVHLKVTRRSWRIAIRASSSFSSSYVKPLTCMFAPPAGLEPAPYGLEVDPPPSMASRMVWSLLVKSVGSSSRYGPVTRCSAWRNDQGNDRVQGSDRSRSPCAA